MYKKPEANFIPF